MSEVNNSEIFPDNDVTNRVKTQITLKDVKGEIKSIRRRTIKANRSSFHIRGTYVNSMDIVLTNKAEIRQFYDKNLKNISDDELIKIYDCYVTDGKKANEFFNSSFASICISLINSYTIGDVLSILKSNDPNISNSLLSSLIKAIIVFFISLLLVWVLVKGLNRDSYKYEIEEVNLFHDKILTDELAKRSKPTRLLSEKWDFKEYKKRNRFLFFFPLMLVRKIKGFFSILFHPFSKLNRFIAHYIVVEKQIQKLNKARDDAKHLDWHKQQIILNYINQKLIKEEELQNKILGGSVASSESRSEKDKQA